MRRAFEVEGGGEVEEGESIVHIDPPGALEYNYRPRGPFETGPLWCGVLDNCLGRGELWTWPGVHEKRNIVESSPLGTVYRGRVALYSGDAGAVWTG